MHENAFHHHSCFIPHHNRLNNIKPSAITFSNAINASHVYSCSTYFVMPLNDVFVRGVVGDTATRVS